MPSLIEQILALQGIQQEGGAPRTGRIGSPSRSFGPTRSNIFVNALLNAGRAESSEARISRQLGIVGLESARSSLPAVEDPSAKARIASDLIAGRSLNVGDATRTPNILNSIIEAGLKIGQTRATEGAEKNIQRLKNKGALDVASKEASTKGLEALLGNEFALLQLIKENPDFINQLGKLLNLDLGTGKKEGSKEQRTKEDAKSKLEEARKLLQ